MQPTYVNMTELASMAASKITNNSQQQQQQPIQQQLQQQPNSPVLSIASSLISSDSSATNQQTSPGSGSQTPQTNTSPHTPSLLASGGGGSSLDEDITQTDEINEKINILSPENDPKCKGSVLEKTSMFEKLEVFNNNLVAMPRSESIYGRKNEEIYKSAGTLDRDSGNFFF